jgi:uncharacterized YccA/Bax inhibitor family protein
MKFVDASGYQQDGSNSVAYYKMLKGYILGKVSLVCANSSFPSLMSIRKDCKFTGLEKEAFSQRR